MVRFTFRHEMNEQVYMQYVGNINLKKKEKKSEAVIMNTYIRNIHTMLILLPPKLWLSGWNVLLRLFTRVRDAR